MNSFIRPAFKRGIILLACIVFSMVDGEEVVQDQPLLEAKEQAWQFDGGGQYKKRTQVNYTQYARLIQHARLCTQDEWDILVRPDEPGAQRRAINAFLQLVPTPQGRLFIDQGEEIVSLQISPLPQGDDLAFTQQGFQSWVPPLAEGYTWGGTPVRAGVHLFDKGALWDERRTVHGEILPKRGRATRLLMRIFWYDHPIDAEFVTGMAQSRISDLLRSYQIGGATVLSEWATPGSERIYAWLSGDKVVFLDLSGMADEKKLLAPFVTQYPPTWPPNFTFDINHWHERLFEMALSDLRTGMEDPVPRLRYDFQSYAFDDGIQKLRFSTLPDFNTRKTFRDRYNEAITKAFEQHILGTENRLDGEAYRAAVRAERERVIAEVEAWRDRLRVAGGVVLTEKGYRMRGHERDP